MAVVPDYTNLNQFNENQFSGLKLPPAGVSQSHPFNNEKNHQKIIEHVIQRMEFARTIHGGLVERFKQIDLDNSASLHLDVDDRKRDQDNRRGKNLKPTDTKLSLVNTQIDEAATYLLSVFAPESDMFKAQSTQDKQPVANAFSNKLNKDAEAQRYYRHYHKAFVNGLKYNLGGFLVEWIDLSAPTVQPNPSQTGTRTVKLPTFSGNRLESLDPYNTYWDPSVNPTEIAEKGEYFAQVEIHRAFNVMRMALNGEIFNVDKVISNGTLTPKYWTPHADIRRGDHKSGGSSGNVDWLNWVSNGASSNEVTDAYEFIYFYCWIIPSSFGLSDSKELEVWRLTVMNSQILVAAEKKQVPHNMLPAAFMMPIEDDLGLQRKSYAEELTPLQTFASFLINVKQRSDRKALYGIKFYNPNVIPIGDKADEDMESAWIPIKPPGLGNDFNINNQILQFRDVPETQNTLEDVDKVVAIMQKILPTDILKQVTDLDRATVYQAAATVQGANRRNLKMAKLIESQCMSFIRFMLMYNVFANCTEQFEVMDKTGQTQIVNPADFMTAGIEYTMADGLKGIDRMLIIQMYKDLMGVIVQSQQALQQFDLPAMFAYMGELAGDDTDLNRFRINDPLQMLDPQTHAALEQLAQSGQLPKLIQSIQQQQNAGAAQSMQGGGAAPPGGQQ